MKIILHLGVHCTDGDEIVECLLKNTDKLIEQGTWVPHPREYRAMMRETLQTLKDEPANDEVQDELLYALLGDEDADRMVLSHDAFLGVAGRSVGHDMLYPLASGKTPRLRNLFAKCDVEFFLGMRDPATFLPSVFERSKDSDFETFMSKADPIRLRWSNLIARIQARAPGAPITLWCNEDTPLIWPDILQAMTGHDEHTVLDGQQNFAKSLMSAAGGERLDAYLEDNPPKDREQYQRIVSAFLEKFALPDTIDQEIDLPGWTLSYIDTLTRLYDEDMANIETLPGIRFLKP